MSETLRVEIDDQIAIVTLNRPAKKNAMSFQMFRDLFETGKTLSQDKTLRAVILTGTEGCFCAGIDLNDLMGMAGKTDEINTLLDNVDDPFGNFFQKPTTIWASLNVPVIAALKGPVLGAGMQLALGADFRIAAPNSQLSVLEAKWGIIPDMGITRSLPHLLRLDQAMELVMTGRVLSGTEAHLMGLVTKTDDDPLTSAIEMAQTLKNSAPNMVTAAKKLLHQAYANSADHLALEAELQKHIIGSAHQMEKAMASMQKRDPVFK